MTHSACRWIFIASLLIVLLWGGPFAAPALASPRAVAFDPEQGLGGLGSYQHEASIAFNPANPSNLVAAFPEAFSLSTNPAGDCRSSFTTDGGSSWSLGGATPLVVHPGDTNVQCHDPSIAADSQGNFYLAYLNRSFGGGSQTPLDVFVAKSTDGGISFSSYAVAVPGAIGVNDADKPYIGADNQPASSFRGSLYVSWTDFGSGQFIKVVYSRDGGVTWSAPATVSKPARSFNITGSVPVVGPDGTVYIFWMSAYTLSANDLSIVFSKSKNGGVTWSNQAAVLAHLPSPGFFNLKNEQPDYGTNPYSGLIGNSFPSPAIAPDGTMYVAWTDFPSGSCTALDTVGDWACTNADVRLSVSRNGGKAWTAPVRVNDDVGTTDQFFPWIATHPDGLLSMSWIDRRLDPNNVDCNTFYTNTSDGVTFLPNVRASSVTSTVGTGQFIGDYAGLAATGTSVYPVWGDLRFGPTTPTDFVARGTLQP